MTIQKKYIKTVHIEGHKVDIYKPTVKNKKYTAVIDGINRKSFGCIKMGHYHDKIGLYKDKDHFDETRRKNFKTRFAK
jgi:hypothetical protein